MYQSSPELMKLQKEQATVEQQLKQLQRNQHRLENRKSYYKKADRKKRTHRLCTIAGTMESIAPDIKLLTLQEVTELIEHIFCLPNVQSAKKRGEIFTNGCYNEYKQSCIGRLPAD